MTILGHFRLFTKSSDLKSVPGKRSDFQVAQRYRIALQIRRPRKRLKNKGEQEEIYGKI
jgi:hypothetical protein